MPILFRAEMGYEIYLIRMRYHGRKRPRICSGSLGRKGYVSGIKTATYMPHFVANIKLHLLLYTFKKL